MAKGSSNVAWNQLDLAPVILIDCGEDVLGDQAIARLVRLALDRDPSTEVTRLDAAAYSPGRLPMLASPSLFGEARMVIVPRGETMNDAFLADALAYVAAPESDVVFVLKHSTSKPRGKKLFDTIRAAGFQCSAIPAIKRDSEKADLVSAHAKSKRRQITREAVQDLVDALGNDVRELLSAVDQLLDDVPGTIDERAVHTYYAGRNEATPFAVADAVIAGRTAEAITLARHAMATGTQAVPIVSAIASKLRGMGLALASRGAVDPKEIKLAPWQLRRARDEVRHWSQEGLAQAVLAIAAADSEVKGGSRSPGFALERAIVRIGQARG
ncbi:DNA polymerase III subunit delta [Ancrocorticia populi]|nr:DNA polymerase III subunit delta [Ancrocorticia populi]MDN6487721.1 DNA polymerase III subunit delta [Ancrocorticia sp.]